MATTATATPGKTGFVKDFLSDHPQGNVKAVNEAWAAAGMTGKIGDTLINKMRSQMGLSGNLRAKSKPSTTAKGKQAPNMPKTATATPGKTGFVKDFLNGNPQANAKAVNEAWTAAGMSGTISHPIISLVRKQLGLTANLSAKPKAAANEKPAPKMSKTASTPGKTMFVKEFLHDHPLGNVDAVNTAWTTAGFEGTISGTLVNQMRAKLGLAGNLRAKTEKPKKSATGKKLGRPRRETTAAVNVQPRIIRSTVLDDLEADIDRLIFKAMGIGDLTEIEDALRRARRLLYVSANGR